MLFFAIQLDEEKIKREGILNLEGALVLCQDLVQNKMRGSGS